MKTLTGIFLLLSTGVTLAQSKKSVPSNSWATMSVTADGILNEWKSPLLDYDEKSYLAYEISNDSANLYVAITTLDGATQVNIMRAGITLGINIDGKKKANTTVSYPQVAGNIRYAERRHNSNRQSGDAAGQSPEEVYRGLYEYMQNAGIKGITGVADGNIDVTTNKAGIIAGLSLIKDTLNVEFIIPLARLGLTPAYANKIAYSLTVNQDELAGGKSHNNRGPGVSSGVGLGVGMGGGMGGLGGGFGVNLGSFGGGRSNGGGKKNSTARIKQVLAWPDNK